MGFYVIKTTYTPTTPTVFHFQNVQHSGPYATYDEAKAVAERENELAGKEDEPTALYFVGSEGIIDRKGVIPI